MTRKCILRHRLAFYLLPGLLLLGMISCTKPSINFGTDIGSDNNTDVKAVDVFDVKVSTVFLDSFPTSGSGTMLLGQYKDAYFGTIGSRSFSEITFPGILPTLTNLSMYDSIELIMEINKTFYGDTSKLQRYLVSQLSSVLNYPGTQTAFYNINSIPFNPTVLGSVDVRINPTAGFTSQKAGDSVKVRLPDSMGERFFNLLYNQSDTVKNAATFRGFFKGLAIYPDTTMPGAIFGFKDSVFVRLYYHDPGIIIQPKFVDFPFTNGSNQFNNIYADRTGTPVQGIGRQHPEIPSTASGNASYLQPATGLYVKLLFPNINSLLQYPDYLSVMRAELKINPVVGSFSPVLDLPPQISLATTTEANTLGPTLNSGTGNLTIDYGFGANTAYTYDITGYIQQQILEGPENLAKNGLLLSIPSNAYNTSFNRVVVGDQQNALKKNQISLTIYYASYY
jgi:hypothetical protein